MHCVCYIEESLGIWYVIIFVMVYMYVYVNIYIYMCMSTCIYSNLLLSGTTFTIFAHTIYGIWVSGCFLWPLFSGSEENSENPILSLFFRQRLAGHVSSYLSLHIPRPLSAFFLYLNFIGNGVPWWNRFSWLFSLVLVLASCTAFPPSSPTCQEVCQNWTHPKNWPLQLWMQSPMHLPNASGQPPVPLKVPLHVPLNMPLLARPWSCALRA